MLILIAALAVGIALTEITRRALAHLALGRGFAAVYHKLRSLRALDDDQQRQRLLLQAGRATLLSSVGALALALLLLGILLLVPYQLAWDPLQRVLYLLGVSIVAPSWWLARRPAAQ